MTKRISIGFDGRYIRTDHHDGISRFSARIGSALHQLLQASDVATVTFIISDEHQLEHLPQGARHVFASSPTSLRERSIAKRLNAMDFDVVFSPMQTMGSRGRTYKLVLTVHDLIYYFHRMPPRQFALWLRFGWRLYHLTWWPQRYLLNRAEAIVAVSQATRQLITRHHLTTKPVFVVYNGTDQVRQAGSQSHASGLRPDKTLVYMGSFLPYKNVESLVLAANSLPEYELLLLSRIHDRDKARLERLSTVNNVRFLNGVTDEQYRDLVTSAHALVTASLDEGFGIPVLEAMAMGAPVICSSIPSFVEVGGDAPLYIDPQHPDTIVTAVRSLTPGERERRVRLGLERASRFSWDESARTLLDVLMDLGRA